MSIKNVLNKLKLRKVNKMNSDESYCYTKIVWNEPNNLIMLISFSADYFESITEIQDAIIETRNLQSKIVYSSYDEEITKKDEDDNIIMNWITHKKYYLLIGGSTGAWERLYMNIHNLGNEVLNRITSEIKNNCDPTYFAIIIDDGVIHNFNNKQYSYDTPIVLYNSYCTDPACLLKRLPYGFTGKDILKFIKIKKEDDHLTFYSNAYSELLDICRLTNETFKHHNYYDLFATLFKDPTVEKLNMLLGPVYKQVDDDSIPGDVSDESLDELFKVQYERFSAVTDDSIHYEDIDEVLEDDDESENMREGDKIDDSY